MELVCPLIDSITASRFPMYVAFPRSEYYQLVRLPVDRQSILALRACLLLQAPPESTGPPVFTRNHLITCRGFRAPEVRRSPHHIGEKRSAFPLERQGRPLRVWFDFGAIFPSYYYGLLSPCLRFTMIVPKLVAPLILVRALHKTRYLAAS